MFFVIFELIKLNYLGVIHKLPGLSNGNGEVLRLSKLHTKKICFVLIIVHMEGSLFFEKVSTWLMNSLLIFFCNLLHKKL